MDLALNNLQGLICSKTNQPTNQPNKQTNKLNNLFNNSTYGKGKNRK